MDVYVIEMCTAIGYDFLPQEENEELRWVSVGPSMLRKEGKTEISTRRCFKMREGIGRG